MKKAILLAGLLMVAGTPAIAGQAEPSALPAAISDKVPAPPAGKGQVVFFRKGGFVGSMISCAVSENGAKVSSLPPGRYFVQVAEPGIHTYSVSSETKDELRMEVEEGETYFAKCAIGMGIMAGRPNLAPSDVQTFQDMSKKLKLVKGATLANAVATAAAEAE